MTQKGKKFLIFTCIFFIMFSTFLGVFTAKIVSNMYFGEQIDMKIDDEDKTGTINVLCMGVDEGGMRSDTMMLVCIDKATSNVNILSIPRDTRVLVGNHYQKINSVIGIGKQEVSKGNIDEPEELSIEKVKALTGLPVNYFATIDFDGFKNVIDVLGGVEYDVPFNMDYDDPAQDLHIHLKKGLQHLDGQAAHDFVRFRKGNAGKTGYAMGDLGRVQAQQSFIKAVVAQKLKPQYLLKINSIYKTVLKNVRTNYSAKELAKHIGVIKTITSENISMHQLPGAAKTISGVSYYICDDAAMEEMAETEFGNFTNDTSSEK